MRIFFRYFLSIFLLVTVILGLMAAVLFVNSSQLMDEMGATSTATMTEGFTSYIEEEGKGLAGVIAESVITPVMLREYTAIGDILKAAQSQSQVGFTYVFDDRGRILHDGSDTLENRGRHIGQLLEVDDIFQEQVVWSASDNLLYCFSPVRIEDTLLGGVCIGLTLQKINQSVAALTEDLAGIRHRALQKNIQVLSLVAAVVLFISLATSFLLARHLSMPIRELASYVGRIGENGPAVLGPARRTDEIGRLARSLNTLSENLKATTVSRDHFRRVLNSMPDGVIVVDPGGRLILLNEAAKQLLGAKEEDMIGREIAEILPWDEASKAPHALLEQKATEGYELVLKRGGKQTPCLVSASRITGTGGETEGGVYVLHDITSRKEAEEVIEAQKERLDVTLRSIGDGVITTDTQGRVVLMNRVAEVLTGYSLTESRGRRLADFFDILEESTLQPRINPVDKVMRTGATVVLDDDTLLQARNGSIRSINISCAPIRDSKGEVVGTVLVFSDTTTKKKLLQETMKAEKLESLGVLAGGIAHDFNNILTAILGNLSYLRLKYQGEKEGLSKITKAEQVTHKAQALTQQLLTFSKGGAPITRATSIKELVADAVQFVLQGSNVKGEVHIQEVLWPVMVDMGQISQVMNNLIFNAVQAMPEGGIVSVRADNVEITADEQLPLSPGRYVQISVRDQGAGIPTAILPKIFDPYFTTKDMGYGLGLSTSYSIIKKHGGHIRIDSEQGKGTQVTFFLPASDQQPEIDRSEPIGPLQGKGNILLMDDEVLIRETTSELLDYLGYTVTTARDGKEAVSLYREAMDSGSPFDCVIMDLTVPGGMGGKSAIGTLREIDPDVCAIVASGYSNDPVMARYREYGFKGVLAKPYIVEEMQRELERALQHGRPA